MNRHLVSLLSAATLVTPLLSAQNVVTDWNGIASITIVSNAGKGSAPSGIWFAYVSVAVYDAVNAVHHHKFKPFYYRGFAPKGSSDEAAAIAAAHRVLVNYFPAQQPNLSQPVFAPRQGHL